MQEERDFQLTLPKRVAGNYLAQRNKSTLDTNLFKISFNQNTVVRIYSVKINPAVQYDNRALRVRLIERAAGQVKESIGECVINGGTVYACLTQNSKDTYNVPIEDGGVNYELTFQAVRNVKLADIKSADGKKAAVPFGFLNNLIKTFLMKLDYHEVGRSKKYFKHSDSVKLDNVGVVLYKGYSTSINLLENGVYLKVDSSTRVVQNETAVTAINKIYKNCANLEKDEKRDRIKSEFIGKVVMANYGNHKYWRVQDVVFDINPDQYKVSKDTNENLTEYYQTKYQLEIKNKRQPLFKCLLNQNKKKGGESQPKQEQKTVLLIPEFCLLSGLPDDFDQMKRRQVSKYTIVNPDVKKARIDELAKSFERNLKQFGPTTIKKVLNLDISTHSQKIQAINLGPPSIALGKNMEIPREKASNFQLFDKPLFTRDKHLEIMIITGKDNDIAGIQKLSASTFKNFGVTYKYHVNYMDFRDRNIMFKLQGLMSKNDNPNINLYWFLLPFNMKNSYGKLKKTAIEADVPKLTQMTVQATLKKKGFASILTKILIQMASKVGNAPWAPKVPQAAGNKTMIIGMDTAADKVQNGTVVAFCATMANDFSQFYSSTCLQKNGQDTSGKAGIVVVNAIKAFYQHNKYFPQQIIILRNGCADSQISVALEHEVRDVKEGIQKAIVRGSSPTLTYIIVDKNASQKVFKDVGGKLVNAPWGTLINSGIVTNNYDFYLVSQGGGIGTVKPGYYKVIYSDSKMQEGVLQQLLYTQCFNYMNWSGSVKVPACLQYAKKLSAFIAGSVNSSKNSEHLNKKLYFI